jgi:glycosyltransferase involved in cell wall biosynthesis
MTKISLIIPCYNESANLPLLINRCKELFNKESTIEIVIVDNGSNDDTALILDKITKHLNYIKRVNIQNNKGYGYGILSGLKEANGDILSWTHADLQTDLLDVLKGLSIFENSSNPELLFVKGQRHGRPFLDVFLTIGMSIFETIFLRKYLWDINAQPTMFHRTFYNSWSEPPRDFSLDLYAYFMAKKSKLIIKRFPVIFSKRIHGNSKWNFGLLSKYRFIIRTLSYSISLKKRLK